jgi:hypothetical protein
MSLHFTDALFASARASRIRRSDCRAATGFLAASCTWTALFVLSPGVSLAGVINPDISVIGQPIATLSDARTVDGAPNPDRNRLRLNVGETEIVFDAYLNPYAKGTIVTSLGGSGLELEEGYFDLLRGLPGGLAVRGGKYRVGFGKLNPAHPHTYPFADRFRVLRAYLPGDESLNETGVSLSERVPIAGDFSVLASADWLQGDTFHPTEGDSTARTYDPSSAQSRPAVLGRLSGFAMAGERSGIEFGVSALRGTNNVAAATRTTVLGADLKAKLWTSPAAYLVLQGEALAMNRDEPAWDPLSASYSATRVRPFGFYAFGDYNFRIRYNCGASYERYQRPDPGKEWDQAFGVFAGYSLMEETTVFRLAYERYLPGSAQAGGAGSGVEAIPAANAGRANTLTLRVIYSMGPHKAHQF